VNDSHSKVHLDALDGLRGVAILMVVYQHTLATAVGNVVTGSFGFRFPYVVVNGWMGVGLFFMLSGFVLALPYYSNVRTMETVGDFRAYYQHRAKRLLPLFVVMAIISYLVGAARGFDRFGSLLLALSTASMFTSSEFFPKINGSFWSLMVEIWFSVLFPFLLLALRRFRLVIAVLPILVLAILVRTAGAYFPFGDNHTNPVKDFFVARIDDFVVGMILANLYAQKKLPQHRNGMMFVAGWMTIVITAFLWDLRMQGIVPLFVVAFFNNLSQVGFGLILVSVLQSGWPRVLVSIWGLRVLGAMCFSVYCWHGLLITPTLQMEPFNLVAQVEYWCALILLSSLTYRFIEFPEERSLAKLFRLAARVGVRSES